MSSDSVRLPADTDDIELPSVIMKSSVAKKNKKLA
jgi:hypothetical protein